MTDDVLPDDAHLRQWICSFPWSLRAPMGYNARLCSALVNAFVREVAHSYRLRAKHHLGLPSTRMAHFGALTLIQRADSAMRLDPHPHALAMDGVHVPLDGRLTFHPLPPPTVQDVHEVALRTALRTEKILERFGIDPAGHLPQEAADEDPVLCALLDASAHGIDLFSERFNQPSLRLVGTPPLPPTCTRPPLLAEVRGINVHAQTWVHGHDRAGIERLVRYVARPPVCNDRLSITDSGRVRYELKKPFKDGTTAIVLHPVDFLARLAALVPPPYFNLTRYHGVLSANSRHRREVVRHLVASLPPPGQQLPLPLKLPQPLAQPWRARPDPIPPRKTPTAGRHPWAYLLKRTFRVQATTCPRCSQPLRLVEIATTQQAIRRVMTRAGLSPMPPPPPIPKLHDQVALQI